MSPTEIMEQASMTAKEYAYKAISFAREQNNLTDAQAQIASAMIIAAALDSLTVTLNREAA